MARIDAGRFRPLYAQAGETWVNVGAFALDTLPVNQREFLAFVAREPRWRRDRVVPLFADRDYLKNWRTPTTPAEESDPVVYVSWFAARAYCEARGARLPTTIEWEYAARASATERDGARTADFRQRALEMALSPRRVGTAPVGYRNAWGVWDLHGGIAEWVLDFNTIFAGADARETTKQDRDLTCAIGATATGDPADYAAFLRYAFRAAVEARTTAAMLGFRCASDLH